MSMRKFANIYSVFIGVGMIVIWSILLLSGQVLELTTEPFRIIAHIFSELITAVFLIVGGILSIKQTLNANAVHLISLGMLFYSVLTAGGYYLQKGDMVMTTMFAALIVLTSVFIFNQCLLKNYFRKS